MLAEETKREKGSGRKGREDVRLSCCFRRGRVDREVQCGLDVCTVGYVDSGAGKPDACECTGCR
jgi:hypothetical protein